MFPTHAAATSHLSFQEVITCLSQHPQVDSLLIIGSSNHERFHPLSDYDLVVVVSDPPTPVMDGLTQIDHRLSDILFITVTKLEQIIHTHEPLHPEQWVGRMVRWLMAGNIVFDRQGRLKQAQTKVRSGEWLATLSPDDLYPTWFAINFNWQHNRRMAHSEDPVYQMALDVRLLYSLVTVFVGYFRLQGLLWEGEKAAIRYLHQHDPAFLTMWQQCLGTSDRTHKMALYHQMCLRVTEPVGGLWPDDHTVLELQSDDSSTLKQIEVALNFWAELISSCAETLNVGER